MKVKFQFWKHSGNKFSFLLFLLPTIMIEVSRSPKICPYWDAWIRLSWLLWTFRIKITNFE